MLSIPLVPSKNMVVTPCVGIWLPTLRLGITWSLTQKEWWKPTVRSSVSWFKLIRSSPCMPMWTTSILKLLKFPWQSVLRSTDGFSVNSTHLCEKWRLAMKNTSLRVPDVWFKHSRWTISQTGMCVLIANATGQGLWPQTNLRLIRRCILACSPWVVWWLPSRLSMLIVFTKILRQARHVLRLIVCILTVFPWLMSNWLIKNSKHVWSWRNKLPRLCSHSARRNASLCVSLCNALPSLLPILWCARD